MHSLSKALSFPCGLNRKLTLCGVLLCSTLAPSVGQAAVVNYQWSSDSSGAWETAGNWTPAPGAVIGTSTATRYDRVTIDKNVVVTRTGNIDFYDKGSGGTKAGTFNALALSNGASLVVSGSLRVSSVSGAPDAAVRNVLIDTGSSLNVGGRITTGIQNSSASNSTWSVKGTVEADSFLGQKTTSTTFSGGFILNIDAGSFTITNTFDWGIPATGTNTGTLGQINLSNNGTFTVGSIANWATSTSSANYVKFLDDSGVFTFGYSTLETLQEVEQFISDGYITKSNDVMGYFHIVDTGSSWQVSVIPEPSTYALLAFGVGSAIFFRRKRSRDARWIKAPSLSGRL